MPMFTDFQYNILYFATNCRLLKQTACRQNRLTFAADIRIKEIDQTHGLTTRDRDRSILSGPMNRFRFKSCMVPELLDNSPDTSNSGINSGFDRRLS